MDSIDLRLALSKGADIAVALGIGRGWGQLQLLSMLDRRFPGMSTTAKIEIIGYGRAAKEAGERILGLAGRREITVEDYYVNPFLFGDEPAARRALTIIEMEAPETGVSIELRLEHPDIPTFDELLGLSEMELDRRIKESPDSFRGKSEEQMAKILTGILYAARRF